MYVCCCLPHADFSVGLQWILLCQLPTPFIAEDDESVWRSPNISCILTPSYCYSWMWQVQSALFLMFCKAQLYFLLFLSVLNVSSCSVCKKKKKKKYNILSVRMVRKLFHSETLFPVYYKTTPSWLQTVPPVGGSANHSLSIASFISTKNTYYRTFLQSNSGFLVSLETRMLHRESARNTRNF
jgi:hypothetical protein